MLAFFRSFSKTWVAAILMAVLALSFALFGMNDVFRPNSGNWVIRVGDRTVEAADFRRVYDQTRQEQEQKSGQSIPLSDIVTAGIDKRLLTELTAQESLAAMLVAMKISPSDQQVVDEIRKTQAFFNQISGQFDQATYESRLAERDMTPARYEGYLRDEIAASQFSAAAVNGLRTPRIYTAVNAMFGLERRDMQFLALDPRRVPPPPEPTDAEINTFYKENSERLKRPEFRTISLVRFSAQDHLASVQVDEAAIRKAYDFKKDTFATPETRSLVQIPVKDTAQGQQVAARLQKGEAPEQVAASLKITPVIYDTKPRSAVVDKKLAGIAFGASSGQVVGPVAGDLGLAVLKIGAITPAKAADYETLRPQILAEARKQMATEKVYNLSSVYDEAHSNGANLIEAAAKAKVAVVTLAPVTADGRGQDGAPMTGLSPEMLKRAFAMSAGEDTGIEEAGAGEYYAVRVEKVIAAAPPPLAEIKGEISRSLRQQAMITRLKANADQVAGRVRKGETLQAVATSVGGRLIDLPGLDRVGAQERVQSLGESLVLASLGAKPGEVAVAQGPNGFFVLARPVKVYPGDPQDLARFTESQRPDATLQYFQSLGQTIRNSAVTRMKARSDISRARLAIGVDPEEVKRLESESKAGAKPEAKAKAQ